ncbi:MULTISPECIES: methionine-R-sulfoxide reductase [Helicobacter]|uniref:peptide-methionine (R)-S-oxide reductase n=1 Tax=Helicobacter bilis ATCC 43879 TaxID=613026 RepID=C3XGH1_9HELI|nr:MULTISPECIES: methionine-R-sulfoxide reductase [Helicobacter]EEO24110.1 methionine-R-sulfoxide reductase [Helicobacter bilis ATCC 43879]MDY5950936.1 methionine-R-sulfoxide reductase [Helicobacter sp.]
MKTLSEFEKYVLLEKGTEAPFSGEYNDFFEDGIYVCKMCEMPLFTSDSKFSGHCGWPSFDSSIENNVKEVLDRDGVRTEIICNHCNSHLGHVFRGEGFTAKNTRHCVNSVSLIFIPKESVK